MPRSSTNQAGLLQVEPLETREVLSASPVLPLPISNVSALVSQGVLQLRGDSLNNVVDITQLADGRFQVVGQEGTRINNQTAPVVLANVVDINAQLRDGSDRLTLSLQNERSVRDVTIDMGTGSREKVVVKGGKSINNLVVTARGTSSLDLSTDGQSLNVTGRTTIVGGNNATQGDNISLLGRFNIVYVETGDGNDTVQLGKKCNCATQVRFSATKATVKTGAGNDELNVFKCKVDDFFADLGAGNDSLAVSIFQFSSLPGKARLTGGTGVDTVREQTGISGRPSYSGFEVQPS